MSTTIIESSALQITMTWSDTWNDITNGGNPRWKVNDLSSKQIALGHITKHASDPTSLDILCPLAGDDQFVHYAWTQGHRVTAIDLVPVAVEKMRRQFSTDDDCWSKEEQDNDMVVWKHKSGTATLYQGSIFTPLPELKERFDAVYDKDSFGALDMNMRTNFCKLITTYVKPTNGVLYTEVKFKDNITRRNQGPPFHVEKKDLMQPEAFGNTFEYVCSLGEVYKLSMPGMKQTGHILRRLASSIK